MEIYMKFLVYRQNATNTKNDITVYSGEDARPFADDNLILIADGLGGTGAIRHLSIVKEMLDRETVVPALFKDVYSDLENETFANYVKDSFAELYLLKDVYDKEHPYVLKKSSYFGSRIVCSALLYRFSHDEELAPEKIFEGYSACEETQKQEYLTALGAKLVSVIKEDIAKAANNANIIRESSITKLKLLATTLCATLVKEHEEYVEAIYFVVGDSLPYYWSESEGLCQVIEDQEGADGGMNGCIHLGGDFPISCKYFRFEKPCVLFNASDGCFESAKFQSPLAFEKLILDAIVGNDSVEAVENKLISDYDTYGTHDDSSTLAMRCFGYESFESFKAACQKRMDALNEEYFFKMQDLLDTDYVMTYDGSKSILETKVAALKDRIASDNKVKEYCEKCVADGSYPENYAASAMIARIYSEKLSAIENEIARHNGVIESAAESLKELISKDFVKFIPFMKLSLNPIEKYNVNEINSAKKSYEKSKKEYLEQINAYQDQFEFTCSRIKMMLDIVENVGTDFEPDSFDAEAFYKIREDRQYLNSLLDFISEVKAKKLRIITKMNNSISAYTEKNKKLAENFSEQIKQYIKSIALSQAEEQEVPEIEGIESVTAQIKEGIAAIREEIERIKALEAEDKKKALSDTALLMLENNFIDLFTVLAAEKSIEDEALMEEALSAIEEYDKQTASIKEKAELQKALFEAYDQKYRKYM
ncbi:MAG: hypothetical protein IJV70_05315 [Clostridia bacterium]|nr:hypothetical protein [Clostridia bacterium]